jgi:hypothetical protein
MARPRTIALLALTLFASACRDGKSQQNPSRPVAAADATPDAREAARSVPAGNPISPDDLPAEDLDKDAYAPAEFKNGADRWRDTGVYVDGKPAGMLSWAELPLSLPVTWIEVKKSAPKRADHPEEHGWRMGKERRYKFTDYFKAIGIDIKRIKEVHVYGPRFSESIVVTGKQLREKKAAGFMFRFGGKVRGKALPVVPAGFANGRSPDKISAVMIYVDKTPPTLVRNLGFVLDGQEQIGVPYYGEPLRGGVRVYLDDKWAAYIKRQELPQDKSTPGPDGQPQWKLYDFLASQGVATDAIVEAWVIRDDKRQERIGKDELATMTFTAGAQASKSSSTTGSILLGPKQLPARAIALHTKPVDPATFPQRDPVEE